MTIHAPTRRSFLKTAAALAASASAHRALHSLAYAALADEGWIELFDGKTLEGWHKNPEKIGHGTGGDWRVEDGAITGEQNPPGSGNGGILLTDRKFGDFELLIDMLPGWGVCSGLFLRATDRGQCFQMMVDYHDAGNVGHIYGEGTGGFKTRAFDINGKYDDDKNLIGMTTDKHKSAEEAGLAYSCTPQEWVGAWKVNDWNTARVTVEGEYPTISTWINGRKIGVFDGATSTVQNYRKDEVKERLGREGSIAVQVHGGRGWPNGATCKWKNIKVRPL